MNELRLMPIAKIVASLALSAAFTVAASAQDQGPPDVGPHPYVAPPKMESHIGNVVGHSDSPNAKYNFIRYCAGCHGERGDGQGENTPWLDPKPRDFTLGTFKCRSTPTGTLPTDEDLFNTIGRGLVNSNMPPWNTFSKQQKADLVAYLKTFSPRWEKEKAGPPITIPPEPPVTIESISHGKYLFTQLECWKCHGPQGRGDGPSASTLTDNKDQPIRPYDFADSPKDARFKCGVENRDIYKIFMTGLDGTPMPSFSDNIKPEDAWDLVHFIRILQVHRPGPENKVLAAAHGVIPPYVEKNKQSEVEPASKSASAMGNE